MYLARLSFEHNKRSKSDFYLLFEVRSLAFIQKKLSIIVVTIREIGYYLVEDNYSSKQLKRIFFLFDDQKFGFACSFMFCLSFTFDLR